MRNIRAKSQSAQGPSSRTAERFGRVLGSIVGSCLRDDRAPIRWLKWLVIGALAIAFVTYTGRTLIQASMSLLFWGGLILVVSKLGPENPSDGEKNCDEANTPGPLFEEESSLFDHDPYSPRNINCSLYHPSHFNDKDRD